MSRFYHEEGLKQKTLTKMKLMYDALKAGLITETDVMNQYQDEG